MNIGAHFRAIAHFDGRETRKEFWPYAGVTFFIYLIVGQIVMMPFVSQMMGSMMTVMMDPNFVNAAASENPFEVQRRVFKAMPDMSGVMYASAAVWLIWAGTLAAAMVRRLRDSGMSPYWALLPLPFHILSLALAPRMFDAFKTGGFFPNGGLFSLLMLNNTLALAAIATLIVLLCRQSQFDD